MAETLITDLRDFIGLDLADKRYPVAARKLAAHVLAIAAAAAREKPSKTRPRVTDVRCRRRPRRKPCPGFIVTRLNQDGRLKWRCSECDDNGLIASWRDAAPKKTRTKAGSVQLKITLLETQPPVWRRIVVPREYTFWDLHMAIQSAMGWTHSHLHAFACGDARQPRQIGIPDPDELGSRFEAGWDVPMTEELADPGDACTYEYDFGDGWRHHVEVETVSSADTEVLPRCVDGRRACPREDCGGSYGYGDIVEGLRTGKLDPELRKWLGDWQPEAFEARAVVFMNPRKALELLREHRR